MRQKSTITSEMYKRDRGIWNSLLADIIIVLQLRFEEFVCKIFYVTIIDHQKKLIVKKLR